MYVKKLEAFNSLFKCIFLIIFRHIIISRSDSRRWNYRSFFGVLINLLKMLFCVFSLATLKVFLGYYFENNKMHILCPHPCHFLVPELHHFLQTAGAILQVWHMTNLKAFSPDWVSDSSKNRDDVFIHSVIVWLLRFSLLRLDGVSSATQRDK